MKSTVETLEATKRKITVEVPYDELKPHIDEAYKLYGEQVSIPGFRPGHVPARIIDQRIGRGSVIQHAINEHIGDFYSQAIGENDLVPLGQPQIDITDLPNPKGAEGGDLKFTIEVEVLPEADVPELDDVTIEVDPVEVSDDEVDEELDKMRARFGTLKRVDRPAKEGDFTSIDLKASVDGAEVDSVSGVSYEIGSKSMLDGMDEALTGMSEGEETEFKTTLKGGEHAGEEGTVKLKLKSVKQRELPELDDDFVQEVSEFDTVAELRADAKKTATQGKRATQALQARDRLMEVLRERMEMPIPAGIMADELEARKDQELSDKERADLEAGIRDQLLLDRLGHNLKPQIGQREMFEYIMQVSQTYGVDPSTMMRDQNQMGVMVGELTRNKALAQLLAKVKVKDTNGADVDMSEFTRDPYAEEQAAANAVAAATEAAEADEDK